MSRWDDTSFDNEEFNLNSDNEETRLLKKFEDYKQLEIIESKKRNSPQIMNNEKSGIFGKSLHAMAVIQGIIITAFTTVLMLTELVNADTKFIILSLVVVALAGEIVIISVFLKKRSNTDLQNNSSKFEKKTEFDGI